MAIIAFAATTVGRARACADTVALEDGTIVGHIAVFGARSAARRIAQFYAVALDAPQDLVNESTMLERIAADHALLTRGVIAADEPFGTIFVAWNDGSSDRIEFGGRKVNADKPQDEAIDGLVSNGTRVFLTTHRNAAAALSSYLDRRLAVERPASRSERIDVAARLEIESGRATWIPRMFAFAHLAALWLSHDGAMRARIESVVGALERVAADVEAVDIGIGFDADALRMKLAFDTRGSSRVSTLLGRARSIAPAPPPSLLDSLPGSVLEGELGVDLGEVLSLGQGGADEAGPPGKNSTEHEIEDTRIVVRDNDGQPALLLCGGLLEKGSDSVAKAIAAWSGRTAQDARRFAIGFRDNSPERLLSLVDREVPRPGGVAAPDRIGFFRFRTLDLLRLALPFGFDSQGHSSDPRFSTVTVERQKSNLRLLVVMPRATWPEIVPRLQFMGPKAR